MKLKELIVNKRIVTDKITMRTQGSISIPKHFMNQLGMVDCNFFKFYYDEDNKNILAVKPLLDRESHAKRAYKETNTISCGVASQLAALGYKLNSKFIPSVPFEIKDGCFIIYLDSILERR